LRAGRDPELAWIVAGYDVVWLTMKFARILVGCSALSVALTSCVAPSKKPDEVDANGKKIEYVWYTPTGSNVPIRVPKDSLKLSDEEAAAQEKDLTDLQRNAPIVPPPSPGGK
jgi:hypothetical protein